MDETIFGVLQKFILRELLFKYWKKYFKNYADDTTPHATGNNSEELIFEIEDLIQKLFPWFAQNKMKATTMVMIF